MEGIETGDWQPRAEDFLIGIHKRTVGEDGRLVLPRSWQAMFGEDCYLWLGKHGEIRAFPAKFWLREALKRDAQPFDHRPGSEAETLFSNTTRLSVDMQGRLILPKDTRERRLIGSLVTLVGCGSYFDVRSTQEDSGQSDQGPRGQR
jgi:DNA-binding transcriptional regulator/RsmH inhibitor MraZ